MNEMALQAYGQPSSAQTLDPTMLLKLLAMLRQPRRTNSNDYGSGGDGEGPNLPGPYGGGAGGNGGHGYGVEVYGGPYGN